MSSSVCSSCTIGHLSLISLVLYSHLIVLCKMSTSSTPRPTTTLCPMATGHMWPIYILATKLSVALFMNFETLMIKAKYLFEMTGTSIVFQKTRIQGNRSLQYTDLCYVCDTRSKGVVCSVTGVHFVGVLTEALCVSVILLCLWQLILRRCLLQVCLGFQDG